MAARSIRLRIEDMLGAIRTIDVLIGGLEFETFDSIALEGQRRGVERCIEIVSEASRHLSEDLRGQYPDIPWRSIRDIGNVLRHGYSNVDNRIIWRIATLSLPELESVLNKMLLEIPLDPES